MLQPESDSCASPTSASSRLTGALLGIYRPKQHLLRNFWRALQWRRLRDVQRQQAALALRSWRLRALQQPVLVRIVCRLRQAQLQLAPSFRRCLHKRRQVLSTKLRLLMSNTPAPKEILSKVSHCKSTTPGKLQLSTAKAGSESNTHLGAALVPWPRWRKLFIRAQFNNRQLALEVHGVYHLLLALAWSTRQFSTI